jgi:hypothetical protein
MAGYKVTIDCVRCARGTEHAIAVEEYSSAKVLVTTRCLECDREMRSFIIKNRPSLHRSIADKIHRALGMFRPRRSDRES